jgi:hypothetical protein
MVLTSMLSSTITNSLTFKAKLILKEDTFNVMRLRTDRLTNNGRSSMLINGRVNPPRENLMKNMVSTSKDHSTLFPNYNHTDTLTWSITETWLLRLLTEEKLKPGGSTKEHWPLRQSTTTNHLISRAQEELTRCKSGAPTHSGSRSSNTEENNLSTSKIREFLQLLRMMKWQKLKSAKKVSQLTTSGLSSMLIKINLKLRE